MARTAANFSVERIDPDTGTMRRVIFGRGEHVKAWMHEGAYLYGVLVGISRETGKARVRGYGFQRGGGVWFPFGAIYGLESGDPQPPQPKVRPMVGLSRVLANVNRRNEPPGGWGEGDVVNSRKGKR